MKDLLFSVNRGLSYVFLLEYTHFLYSFLQKRKTNEIVIVIIDQKKIRLAFKKDNILISLRLKKIKQLIIIYDRDKN